MPTRLHLRKGLFLLIIVAVIITASCRKTVDDKSGTPINTLVLQPSFAHGQNVSIYEHTPYLEGPETTYVGIVPDTLNFNGDSVLSIQNYFFESGNAAALLIRFDSLPAAGTEIDTATLYLYGLDSAELSTSPQAYNYGNRVYPPGTKMDSVTVQQLTGNWQTYSVTWRNQPTAGTPGSFTIAPPAARWGYNVSINITQMVKAWVADPLQNFGCRLGYVSHSGVSPYPSQLQQMQFYSSYAANAQVRPKLVIKYR